MWTLMISIILSVGSQANTYTTVKPQLFMARMNSSICDQHPPKIDPELCCDLPDFFNESIVKKCELDFPLADKSSANLMTDSCIIECIFDKSGFSNGSKIDKAKMTKLIGDKMTNEKVWKNKVEIALTMCFEELTDDELAEISRNLKQDMELNKNPMKICDPSSSVVLDCLYRELFKICPQEKTLTTTTECTQLKNYAVECDDW